MYNNKLYNKFSRQINRLLEQKELIVQETVSQYLGHDDWDMFEIAHRCKLVKRIINKQKVTTLYIDNKAILKMYEPILSYLKKGKCLTYRIEMKYKRLI